MIKMLTRWIRCLAQYDPLKDTARVRAELDADSTDGWPRLPDFYGDLIYMIIRRHGFKRCLQTGFFTGASAAYMAEAVTEAGGEVISISVDEPSHREIGQRLLKRLNYDGRHQYIDANSNRVVAKYFVDGETFDFIYLDGWKTFDHLAYETYIYNQLLPLGGVLFFDDTHMPSVHRTVEMMKRYYGYEEVDFLDYNHTKRLRFYHIVTRRSFRRFYRALIKTTECERQAPTTEPYFDRKL